MEEKTKIDSVTESEQKTQAFKKNFDTRTIWGIAFAVIIIFLIYVASNQPLQNTATVQQSGSSAQTDNSLASTQSSSPNTENSSATLPSTDPQHASDYISAYLSALSSLYQSTQTYANVQAQYGNTNTNFDTNLLISLAEMTNDLKDAQTVISPYINDSDKSISVTATLLYADIGIEINSVTQMQSSYTEGINNQDVTALQTFKTQLVTFAADKSALESDLLKALQIVKYIIQNPTNNPNPTGSIDYIISPDNRSSLLQQMGTLFPTPLDHAAGQSNIYLFYARAISLFLSSNTYEQQATVKI